MRGYKSQAAQPSKQIFQDRRYIMNVVLIPFLLGAQLTRYEPHEWPYGAESTFHCYTSATGTRGDHSFETRVSFPMQCRTRNETTIRCEIPDIRVESSDLKVNKQSIPLIQELLKLRVPFEFHFDPEGVKSISILGSAQPYWLHGLRRIAILLSAGTDLEKHRSAQESFIDEETMVLGKCNTTFWVSREPYDDLEANELIEKKYTLTSPVLFTNENDQNVTIKRFRGHGDCERSTEYIKVLQNNINVHSYYNKMHVTNTGKFESIGDVRLTESIHITPEPINIMRTLISIELKNIEPATRPLLAIPTIEPTVITVEEAQQSS